MSDNNRAADGKFSQRQAPRSGRQRDGHRSGSCVWSDHLFRLQDICLMIETLSRPDQTVGIDHWSFFERLLWVESRHIAMRGSNARHFSRIANSGTVNSSTQLLSANGLPKPVS